MWGHTRGMIPTVFGVAIGLVLVMTFFMSTDLGFSESTLPKASKISWFSKPEPTIKIYEYKINDVKGSFFSSIKNKKTVDLTLVNKEYEAENVTVSIKHSPRISFSSKIYEKFTGKDGANIIDNFNLPLITSLEKTISIEPITLHLIGNQTITVEKEVFEIRLIHNGKEHDFKKVTLTK